MKQKTNVPQHNKFRQNKKEVFRKMPVMPVDTFYA
jgi:hypothetical protein